ncbi:hypothetical protein ETH_00035935 [Eimeria tenella]|uniref:Uncharacterized protein n=1 Tax=Eimeria tenella TaxID=5802 RepID=U6KSC5_EIMTE|nr:hypothetical protein ETH_00035935 [Eimeria tenella]CDJ39274.1 hypothetical protein ETH_00035935 [Eimeria tenella]|eukprot:XP_013230029.1 hypothetical protein ETH_00035935 [Eimeria tenella]
MEGPLDPSNKTEVAAVGGASVCGNALDAPSAERLLWGTVVAEKEKRLRGKCSSSSSSSSSSGCEEERTLLLPFSLFFARSS